MNGALWKDTLREIRHSVSRFISILVIIALGVGFFVGIKCAGPSMLKTADTYFQTQNLMDFKIQSTIGFSDEDIQAVTEMNGISQVMPSYSTDAILRMKNRNTAVKIMALPQDNDAMNIPILIKGRMPQNANECVIDHAVSQTLPVGSTVQLAPTVGQQQLSDNLKRDRFTVVGVVKSPQYISGERGTTTIGDGNLYCFLMVPQENFAYERYTELYVRTEVSKSGVSAFDNAYKTEISQMQSELEALGKTQAEASTQSMLALQQAQAEAALAGNTQPQTTQPAQTVIPQWYVQDRTVNPGYGDFKSDTQRVDAVASVFPIFFIAVVILVTLTTMTRMVEDHRTQIGTLKALGYSSAAIAGKFFIYSCLAGILGCTIGLSGGIFLFPKVIFTAYGAIYPALPSLIYSIPWLYPFLASLVAILCTTCVSIAACYRSLRVHPAALMRPKAPKPGKRILLERIGFLWKHLRFTSKVTARNLFRYKARLCMTILGVAGCTALIIAALGLNDAVSIIGKKQFSELTHYNVNIIFDTAIESESTALKEHLQQSSLTTQNLFALTQAITPHNQSYSEKMDAYLIVPETAEQLKDFITLRQRAGHKTLSLTDDGVIISEKMALKLGLKTGDTVHFTADNTEHTAKVTGITENYAFHYIYMSPAVYYQLFDKAPAFTNAFTIVPNLNDNSKNEIAGDLLERSDVMALTYNDAIINQFYNTITSMQAIVIVIVLTAGALAFVVLYNLTNINIEERVREIATIRVLGFNTKETAGYVFRENVILTLLGIAVGLGLGTWMTDYVVNIIEMELVMFGRGVSWISYISSILITAAFAALVMILMFFKVRKINMIEALKSNE